MKYILLFILFYSVPVYSEPVSYADLVGDLKERTDLAPVAAYPETHITNCHDSQSTKKLAHIKSAGIEHKRLDNQMILGFVDYCCDYEFHSNGSIKSKQCDPQCVTAVRRDEALQRERGGRELTDFASTVFSSFISGAALFMIRK